MDEKLSDSNQKGSKLVTVFRIKKERLNWLDSARGLVVFIMLATLGFPSSIRHANPFIEFFLEHPSNNNMMDIYDIGVPAFLFIIGLLYYVSFYKRRQRVGTKFAVLNAVLRWGLIFIIGFIIIALTWEGLVYPSDPGEVIPGKTVPIVAWDVIYAIGAVGLMCIPFMFLNMRVRLIVSYGLLLFYQIMMNIPGTYWREYALASVHGGVLGGIFVQVPIVLIGSVIGEYFLLHDKPEKKVKYKHLAIFGILNFAIGFIMAFIPGWWASKRQSSMAWAVISIGVIIGGCFLFIFIDEKTHKRMPILYEFGKNPFLLYVVGVVSMYLIEELVPADASYCYTDPISAKLVCFAPVMIYIWLIHFAALTTLAIILGKLFKPISTTKVAIGTLILLFALAAILIPLGVI
ncbi:MAG: hypothetical protein ACTSWN_17155 [Promethearchaeota archaeon]